jgi:hypothetical protein
LKTSLLRLEGGCLDGLEIIWPDDIEDVPAFLQFSFEAKQTEMESRLQQKRWREVEYVPHYGYTDEKGREVQEYLPFGDKTEIIHDGTQHFEAVTPPVTPRPASSC